MNTFETTRRERRPLPAHFDEPVCAAVDEYNHTPDHARRVTGARP